MHHSISLIKQLKNLPHSIREYYVDDPEILKLIAIFEELSRTTTKMSTSTDKTSTTIDTTSTSSQTVSQQSTQIGMRSERVQLSFIDAHLNSFIIGVVVVVIIIMILLSLLIVYIVKSQKKRLIVLSKAPKAKSETWDTIADFQID